MSFGAFVLSIAIHPYIYHKSSYKKLHYSRSSEADTVEEVSGEGFTTLQ